MQYITKNCAFKIEFELFQTDGASPLDCSSSTFKFIVKKNRRENDGLAIIGPTAVVNSQTNRILFQYDATDTAFLQEGVYICALKKFTNNDLNEEIWTDDLTVIKGVFND